MKACRPDRPPARIAACMVLILSCAAVLASGPDPDYSRGILDRKAVLESAAEVTALNNPDAEEVLVAGALRVSYNPDGTFVQWREEYSKILTDEARERNRTVSSYFTVPYQRGPEDCSIPLLEIIRPDGKVVPVDVEAGGRVMVNPGSMAMNIYNPNDKLISVGVPDLRLGDILHFVMFDRTVQPRVKDSWADWIAFESTRPILHDSVIVSSPSNLPLKSIALKAPVEGTVSSSITNTGARIEYSWTARNVPRMFPEPNMPDMHTVVQRLLVSTSPDWETISRWYWSLSLPHLSVTPAISAKVRELVEGVSDPLARIGKLFRFVSQEIRYMGITTETTAPGYEPHDVCDTFEARHGVCRDKAALLVAMLREAGFEAFPTLIHTGSLKDPEVPQPFFNHAIVAARDAGGDYILMDPTNESTKDLLPSYLCHKSYLVATPEGDRLRVSPVDPAEKNLMHVVTRASLDPLGGISASTALGFNGVNDVAYRGMLARNRPDDRRKFFEGLARRVVPGARLTDLSMEPADPMDTSFPLTVMMRYQAPDFPVDTADACVVPVPVFGTSIGMVNFLIGQTGLKERRYPLYTEIACGVRETIELDIGDALGPALALPASWSVTEPDYSWRLACSQTGTILRAEGEFLLTSVEFEPDRYLALKKTLAEIEAAHRSRPVFEPRTEPAPAPDAVIEDSSVSFDLAGPGSWKQTSFFRKRILSYAGKKSNSELKISYNEGLETVRIESASVISRDGSVKIISTNEINVMDQPWVASAPRYPAGRTLVASLPGVEIGSVIECAYVRETAGRPFFDMRESFRFTDPLVRKVVTVNGGAARDLRVSLRQGADPSEPAIVASTNAAGSVSWEASNVRRLRSEDSMPPWWSFAPTAYASTGDGKTYSADLLARLTRAASGQRAAADAARRIVRGARSPSERLQRIRDAVAEQVRPAGPGLSSLPLSAITPADRTLSDGYGNTADRAVLIFAMLRAAGFKPQFVLASPYQNVSDFDPGSWPGILLSEFQEVLVLVPDPDNPRSGSFVYLNDTDQYGALGASPSQGCLAVDLATGDIREVVPSRPDRSRVEYDIRVSTNGDAVVKVRRFLYGNEIGAERRRFAELTPEERRRFYQELVGEWSQEGEGSGPLGTDFNNYPARIEYGVAVPRFAAVTGSFMDLRIPASLDSILTLRSDTRSNPLYLSSRHKQETVTRVYLPEGYELAGYPRDTDIQGPAGSAIHAASDAAFDPAERVLTIRTIASLAPCVVPPAGYAGLLEMDRALSHQRMQTVLLRKAEPGKASTVSLETGEPGAAANPAQQ